MNKSIDLISRILTDLIGNIRSVPGLNVPNPLNGEGRTNDHAFAKSFSPESAANYAKHALSTSTGVAVSLSSHQAFANAAYF